MSEYHYRIQYRDKPHIEDIDNYMRKVHPRNNKFDKFQFGYSKYLVELDTVYVLAVILWAPQWRTHQSFQGSLLDALSIVLLAGWSKSEERLRG